MCYSVYNLLDSLLQSRCCVVLFFENLNTFISKRRLVLGLREHPTTEQHGSNFNADVFNRMIKYVIAVSLCIKPRLLLF